MEQLEEQNQKIDFKNLDGGLEILVQLAEKKEIDPWDIDIIEITDKFLAALDKSPRENLLNAGRAIFYASVLLRLKSEILLNMSNETLASSQMTDNFFPEDELLFDDQGELHLDLTKLESFIVRSSLGKQQRKRKITLNDLIIALQQADDEEERRAIRAKLRAERAFSIAYIDTPEDVLEIAQDEDIEDITNRIEAIIEEHLTDDKPITLNFLCGLINEKPKIFLAILFLAHSQKIILDQTEFYGEIFIHKVGTNTANQIISKQEEEKKETDKSNEKKSKKGGVKGIIAKIKDKMKGKKKKNEAEEIKEEIIEMNQEELKIKETIEKDSDH